MSNIDYLDNLINYLGVCFIEPGVKIGNKVQFKHNKNKKYRQIVCSLLTTGIDVEKKHFNYIAYALDNNTVEILILTELNTGNGRGIAISGII